MIRCAICEDVINERDSRYELPDGDVVCTARDCIYDWVRQYKKSGHFIEPYLWVEDEYYEN